MRIRPICPVLAVLVLVLAAGRGPTDRAVVNTGYAQSGESEAMRARNELFDEQVKHTGRLARLAMIHQLASEDDYTDMVNLAESLMQEEYKRHQEVLDKLREVAEESDSNAPAWWKDVGKRPREPNSPGALPGSPNRVK
jgi:hypothetical protein